MASSDDEFTGTLRGELTRGDRRSGDAAEATVWVVESDDGVYRAILDNTGMGIGGECLVTGSEDFWAWVRPATGRTVTGSKVTFRRVGGAS